MRRPDADHPIEASTAEASSDEALIDAAQQGNVDAFAELVGRYQRAVRTCLAVRLASPHDAEDLAQEVFVTAFGQLSQFERGRPFGPWLRGIALNLLRNHRRKFRPEYVGGHAELGRLLEEHVAMQVHESRESSLHDALLDCLERMDELSRALLRRRYADDVSVRALAAELQHGYSAMTMRLHRLRMMLANCVERKRVS